MSFCIQVKYSVFLFKLFYDHVKIIFVNTFLIVQKFFLLHFKNILKSLSGHKKIQVLTVGLLIKWKTHYIQLACMGLN